MYGFERISLASEGDGLCGDAGIEAHKPAVMEPYLNDEEWDVFCEKVNGAIRPIHTIRRCAITAFALTFVSLVVVIFAPLFIGHHHHHHNDDHPNGSANSGPMIFVLPTAMVLLTMGVFIYGATKSKEIQKDIQTICDELSAKHPKLVMTVRYDAHYSASDVRARATQYIDVSTSAQPRHGAVHASHAKRLAQLDQMKHMLTQREYAEKRSEILTGV